MRWRYFSRCPHPDHPSAGEGTRQPSNRRTGNQRSGNQSNWGQIPIQDSHLPGARGDERNWALTPIEAPKRVSPAAPRGTPL